MALLTKDQILTSEDLKTLDVEVPEWGGTIRLSMMTGRSRDLYEAGLYKGKDNDANYDNMRAKYLSYCIVNEEGNLMFTIQDVLELGKKSSVVIDRLFTLASELNATSNDAVEDIAKN
jgi:hypothetical protein